MKNKQDATVATLVILCSLMLLGALLFAISGDPWRKPHLRFSVDFADVTGIHRNTAVLYAGDKIGVVERIEHLAPADRLVSSSTVRVHIEVFEKAPVPANVKVLISAESILGEKHIALVRKDDESGLLVDGAKLSSTSLGSMLEMMIPGGDAIFADIKSITSDLRKITDPLGKGDASKKINESLANIEAFTQELKTTFAGDDKTPGFGQKINAVADKLDETATGIQELVKGPKGAAEKGLAPRADAILANLEGFSKELHQTIGGTPDGKPGLKTRLEEITTDLHKLFAGGENASGPGLEKHLDTTMRKINTLVEEMNALVVWGEYITGTLAEKPSRLIFGSKENDVPSKEEIIEHMRRTHSPYPVRIKELESGARPAPKPVSPMPPESATPEEKKKGLLDIFKRRE
ncbi:MlaD family protein [Prosthecobacter sp.]|uniref:MlaD family protein n=1 Tax=Prosthecobacter sp. TaxID=1965333 RepID=UPI001DE5DFC8|nr:MlaD family protein [Prosthecobacter sp.]MCB1277130.1 MCE family protein [Prosthecobacter sp.]